MSDTISREYLAEATATVAEELTADFMPHGERRVFDVRGLKPFTRAGKKRVKVYLRGQDLPWIPCTIMLRVLKHEDVWGDDPAKWLGRKVELYIDPKVRNPDGEMTGGIRISAVSNIASPTLSPTVKLGRKWGPWPLRRIEGAPQAAQRPQQAAPLGARLNALVKAGTCTADQARAALAGRAAAEIPESEHDAILARLSASEPREAAAGGEE